MSDLTTVTFLDKVRTHVAYLILEAAKDPVDAAKTMLLFLSPVLIIAGVFAWKLQVAIKKQEKTQNKRTKILKKLHKGRNENKATENEKCFVSDAVLDRKEVRKLAEMVCNEHLKTD